ncbi:MAG: DUF2000 domain-containing protein [Provencibacterium sp.]|jgi:hypothetical protein|nr:DUF2000 domain-containing protein [Provencibacterium sp.]
MENRTEKCVLVLDKQLPPGLAANAAVILGISMGRCRPDIVGERVYDREGQAYEGIVRFPVPVLQADAEQLKKIREQLLQPGFERVASASFTSLAQGCRSYEAFIKKMAATPGEQLECLGIALCGGKRAVNRLTGTLPLLR